MIGAAAIALIVAIALMLIRALRGPTLYDRVLAVNSLGTKIVLFIGILGFVLGSLFENNLRRALSISGGDWGILVQDYKSVTLYILAILVVVAPVWLARRARKMEGDATAES